eukprot:scaffold197277_cov16-Prasinocladus_malaysianus.AAC.1
MRGVPWAQPRISGRRPEIANSDYPVVAHFGLAIASSISFVDLQPPAGSSCPEKLYPPDRPGTPY